MQRAEYPYLRRSDTLLARSLLRISPKTGEDYLNSKTKKVMEVTIATAAAIPAVPIGILIGGAITLIDRINPLYRQKRLGRNGKEITVTKLQTMKPGSDAVEVFGANGRTDGEDPRLTRVGKRIRPFELDELPQLLDVIRGKQALIAARTAHELDVEELAKARQGLIGPQTARNLDRERFGAAIANTSEDLSRWESSYRPGLVSLASLDRDRKDDEKRRYHPDVFYPPHASLGFDLYILKEVAKACLTGRSYRRTPRQLQRL